LGKTLGNTWATPSHRKGIRQNINRLPLREVLGEKLAASYLGRFWATLFSFGGYMMTTSDFFLGRVFPSGSFFAIFFRE